MEHVAGVPGCASARVVSGACSWGTAQLVPGLLLKESNCGWLYVVAMCGPPQLDESHIVMA